MLFRSMAERQHKAELDASMERDRIALEQWKAQLQSETAIITAQIAAESKADPASTEIKETSTASALASAIERFTQVMAAPKTIIRDATGRAVGVQHIIPDQPSA